MLENHSWDGKQFSSGSGLTADVEYHLRRARCERDIAYRTPEGPAADAHMKLSALHLQRALELQEVRRGLLAVVQPFRQRQTVRPRTFTAPGQVVHLPSVR
ncbi:hypothetical protein ACUXST_002309 [Sphingomonas sp. F9_3S_D5_B_2]